MTTENDTEFKKKQEELDKNMFNGSRVGAISAIEPIA